MSGTGATVALGSSNSYDTDGTVVSYDCIQKTEGSITLSEQKKCIKFLIIVYFFTHLLNGLFVRLS